MLRASRAGTFDVRHCCNGLLAGLVAVTSCAGFVEPWAAVVIGSITGPLYIINSRLLLRLRIDDPLDSSTVHFASGIVGTLAVAFFAKPEYALTMASNECAGIVYSSSGWTQLGVQTLGKCCTAAHCCCAAAAAVCACRGVHACRGVLLLYSWRGSRCSVSTCWPCW
jgi:Amt family ammonium transporter